MHVCTVQNQDVGSSRPIGTRTISTIWPGVGQVLSYFGLRQDVTPHECWFITPINYVYIYMPSTQQLLDLSLPI